MESCIFVNEKENGEKNNIETNGSLSDIINNFFNKEHSYYKSSSLQEVPIIATIVRKGWHRKLSEKRPQLGYRNEQLKKF